MDQFSKACTLEISLSNKIIDTHWFLIKKTQWRPTKVFIRSSPLSRYFVSLSLFFSLTFNLWQEKGGTLLGCTFLSLLHHFWNGLECWARAIEMNRILRVFKRKERIAREPHQFVSMVQQNDGCSRTINETMTFKRGKKRAVIFFYQLIEDPAQNNVCWNSFSPES